MNYNEFYKQAGNEERSYSGKADEIMPKMREKFEGYAYGSGAPFSGKTKPPKSKKTGDTGAPKSGSEKGWSDTINGIEGYQSHLPMLALLAGAGALGGWSLAGKNKGRAGAIYGGMSLPALYLAYLAGRRNDWFGGDTANAFDSFSQNWINKPVNDTVGGWFGSDEGDA